MEISLNLCIYGYYSFPDLMSEHTHYAHCYIPAAIAAVLDEKPALVAPAVRAFYFRDPIDLKVNTLPTIYLPVVVTELLIYNQSGCLLIWFRLHVLDLNDMSSI